MITTGRIDVFGADGKEARLVADAFAREAFHNVSLVASPVDECEARLAERVCCKPLEVKTEFGSPCVRAVSAILKLLEAVRAAERNLP